MFRVLSFLRSSIFSQRIKVRIIRRYSAIIFIAIFSLGFFSYSYLSTVTEYEINSYSNIVINQISKNLNSSFSNLENTVNSVYNYNILREALELDSPSTLYEEMITAKKVSEVIRNILFSRKDIEKVTLYSIKNQYLYTLAKIEGYDFRRDTTFQEGDWFKKAIEKNGKLYFHTITDLKIRNEIYTPNVMSIYKTLSWDDLSIPVGIIRIDLNFNEITTICNEVNAVNNGRVIIIDRNKNIDPSKKIIYDNYKTSGDLFYENLQFMEVPTIKQAYESINGKKYLVKNFHLEKIDWTISYLIPTKSIYKSVNTVKNITILFGLVILILTIFLSAQFARNLSAPLEKLTKHLKRIEKEDFVPFSSPCKNDEVGDLISGINSMTEKINHLIHSQYKAQLLAKDAQFNALMTQINPHFLYNIMENISGIGYSRGIPELSVITENLIDLLKYSVNNKSTMVELRIELEHTRKYIILQNARFGNNIRLNILVPDELLDYPILKFTLQPLVENSVLHGLSAKSYHGVININAKIEDGKMIIEVADDGIGIDPDQLVEIKAHKEIYNNDHKDSKYHVGLYNVHSRLEFYYGSGYGLLFESEKGKGTKIIVVTPVQ